MRDIKTDFNGVFLYLALEGVIYLALKGVIYLALKGVIYLILTV